MLVFGARLYSANIFPGDPIGVIPNSKSSRRVPREAGAQGGIGTNPYFNAGTWATPAYVDDDILLSSELEISSVDKVRRLQEKR